MKKKYGCMTRVSYELLSKVFSINPHETSPHEILLVAIPVIKWNLYCKGDLPKDLIFDIRREIESQSYIITVCYYLDEKEYNSHPYFNTIPECTVFASYNLFNTKGL